MEKLHKPPTLQVSLAILCLNEAYSQTLSSGHPSFRNND
jgi:hypothetical protein